MPAAAYEKEASAAGRVAAFLTFRTFRPRPHAVHLPSVYQDVLRFLYEGLDDNRDFRISKLQDPLLPQNSLNHGASVFPHDVVALGGIAVETPPTLDNKQAACYT